MTFGISAAGSVSQTFIGRLSAKAFTPGPVSAVSYRVASRIANTLRPGFPVRTAGELNQAQVILFHSPQDQMRNLLRTLVEADIEWRGKSLLICDCSIGLDAMEIFRAKGASVAIARQFEVSGYLVIEGNPAALIIALRMARNLRLKPIELNLGTGELFDASITLGTSALTPLLDQAAAFMRQAGVRDIEAAGLAATVFEQTAKAYAHSGRQSWRWYVRGPDTDELKLQLEAAREFKPLMLQLLSFGFKSYDKHSEAAVVLKLTPGLL